MLLSIFPEEIINTYNLRAMVVDSVKQAGLLANQLLQQRLVTFG
jgi:hypothetical protein